MRHATLTALVLILATALGHAQPTYPALPSARSVMVNEAGQVIAPSNFFTVNSASFGLVLSNSSGGINVKAYGATGNGVTDDTVAIQAALDDTPYGGTLILPLGQFLITNTLYIRRPITFTGQNLGSVLLVSSNTPATSDALRCVANAMYQWLRLQDFAILPQSGTPGRHGIVFDVRTNGTAWSDSSVERVHVRTRNGAAMVVDNSNLDHDGFFTSQIQNCLLEGGMILDGVGDSVRIRDNTVTFPSGGTTNAMHGITVRQISAADPAGLGDAKQLVIEGNNLTPNGGIRILAATEPKIIRNNMELYGGQNIWTNKALIALVGDSDHVIFGAEIRGNFLGAPTHSVDRQIDVGWARDTLIDGNRITPSGGTITGGVTNDFWQGIYIRPEAFETRVAIGNIWTYPTWYSHEGHMVGNAGVHTVVEQVGNSLQDVPYAASVLYINPDECNTFRITVTDGNAFTITNPKILGLVKPVAMGHRIHFIIRNATSGSLGTITWGSNYVISQFQAPAAGRTAYLTVMYDADGKWREMDWSPVELSSIGLSLAGAATPQAAQQTIHRISPANPDMGPLDLLWIAMAGARPYFGDPEFAAGTNSVQVYNAAGGTKVTLARETDQITTPNRSRVRLKVAYDGSGTYNSDPAPYFGGFAHVYVPGTNQVFLQRFTALLPAGLQFIGLDNGTGSNATNYWLTPTLGTGKWEHYARVIHCGNTGSFVDGGYIAVAKAGAWADSTPWTLYLANANVYRLSSAMIDFSDAQNGALTPQRLTTAQRDALATPADGNIVYNTSTGKLQVRASGSWVDLH